MSLYLSNASDSFVEFQSGVPSDYSGPYLPGSKILYFAKDTCQLIIQEIATELYTLRLNVYHFFKTVGLNVSSAKAGIHSRILLKGNICHKIKGTGAIYLREGEFTMLWSGSVDCGCKFEKDKEYRTIDIFYSPGLVQQLTTFFPDLSNIMKKEQARLLIKSPCWMTPSMQDILHQIMQCPFDEGTRQFYFDLKVREFLYVMLEHAYNRPLSRYRFTAYETASIIKAHSILLEDISKKPFSIRQLSRAVAINDFKLKAGFRQIFGLSIFDSLHEARMEKARQLLLSTNKPIKEICVLAGYPRMTNFITAFRRRFGYTPGSLRRN